MRQIFQTMFQVTDMIFLLLVYILFWAVVMYNMFLPLKLNQQYFSTLGQSYMSLFIALTTGTVAATGGAYVCVCVAGVVGRSRLRGSPAMALPAEAYAGARLWHLASSLTLACDLMP